MNTSAAEQPQRVDITRADAVTEEVAETVHGLFRYAQWDSRQIDAGGRVRKALEDAVLVIIESVPPCPTRTRAINHPVDCRMLSNAAITHRGRF